MDKALQELWKRTLARLQQIVAPQLVQRWFQPIRVSHMEGQHLCVRAPSHLYRFWLEDNYGDLLRETLSAVAGKPLNVKFVKRGTKIALPAAFPTSCEPGVL